MLDRLHATTFLPAFMDQKYADGGMMPNDCTSEQRDQGNAESSSAAMRGTGSASRLGQTDAAGQGGYCRRMTVSRKSRTKPLRPFLRVNASPEVVRLVVIALEGPYPR